MRDNARADPMLPASRAGELAGMYLHGADAADPRASPLFADFAGAGPVWLTAGDTEILLDDTRRMARRPATKAGGRRDAPPFLSSASNGWTASLR